MAISKIILNGVTQMDLTSDTVEASNLLQNYTAHGADGEPVVGTASGGGSSWTLIKGNQELTASTTSTQASEAGTINCGSSIYTSAKIVWVHIRDKAGPRAGYFYGSDTFFINHNPKNNATSIFTTPAVETIRYTTSNAFNVYSGLYGVFGYSISSDGVLTLRKRYNGSYSLTVNGTYVIDVYTLDLPTGETIFG